MSSSTVAPSRDEDLAPPRENLFRASRPGLEVRAAGDGAMPTLYGHFAVFDEWTEINDIFEGNFMERFLPGAFKKTFREQRDEIKVLFQHGHDPQIGDKPLGTIGTLEEDDIGARYEVPMLDTTYNRDLVPGLEAGVYGASFRFRVLREEIDNEPEPSDANPEGLPERTVKEAQVYEFSPVTFPAYLGATAAVRSLSQHFNIFEQLGRDPERARGLLGQLPDETREQTDAPASEGAEATPHPDRARRVDRIPLIREEKPWRLP